MSKKRKPLEERKPEDYREAAGNSMELAKALAGQGGTSDQDFLERMARSDDLVDHDGEMVSSSAISGKPSAGSSKLMVVKPPCVATPSRLKEFTPLGCGSKGAAWAGTVRIATLPGRCWNRK